MRSTSSNPRSYKASRPMGTSTELHTWICRNTACRAVLSAVDNFCKKCSCCICFAFEENKDPTLWLACTSDSSSGSCELACHIECALRERKSGHADLGPLMLLDGSYCCMACGKVSEILGVWKKQLTFAANCLFVGTLCHRVYLSFRLFNGTLRFQKLHECVKQAKEKLESEVGPLGEGLFKKLANHHIRTLFVSEEVQALCKAAVLKADEVSATFSRSLDGEETSVPAAFNFNNNNNEDPELDSGLQAKDTGKSKVKPGTSKADGSPSKSKGLYLKITRSFDLNEDAAPHSPPRGESENLGGGSENPPQHGPFDDVPADGLQARVSNKRPASDEARDSDGGMVQRPLRAHTGGPNNLDQNYESCVTVIRDLELKGHITREFRRDMLTWLSWSNEWEQRLVNNFIETLGSNPPKLAEQLVDTLGDVITNEV